MLRGIGILPTFSVSFSMSSFSRRQYRVITVLVRIRTIIRDSENVLNWFPPVIVSQLFNTGIYQEPRYRNDLFWKAQNQFFSAWWENIIHTFACNGGLHFLHLSISFYMANPKLQFIKTTNGDKLNFFKCVMIYKQNCHHEMLLGKENPTANPRSFWSR